MLVYIHVHVAFHSLTPSWSLRIYWLPTSIVSDFSGILPPKRPSIAASRTTDSPQERYQSIILTTMDLSESQTTFPSDSENYDANHSNQDSSEVPISDTSSPMILYSPPTFWSILRGAAINLLLPFVNGLMLGFGELFAHEAAFRLGWSNTKVCLHV